MGEYASSSNITGNANVSVREGIISKQKIWYIEVACVRKHVLDVLLSFMTQPCSYPPVVVKIFA